MDKHPDHRDADPFRPPTAPTTVRCSHCGCEYDSQQIEWRRSSDPDSPEPGAWSCPTPNCPGMGFGHDILPTDPNYEDQRPGWCTADEPYNQISDPPFDEDDRLPEDEIPL